MSIQRNCPVCSSTEHTVLGHKKESSRRDQELEVVRCRRCSTVHLSRRSEAFEAELYDYYRRRVGKSESELYNPITTSRYRDLLEGFERQVSGRCLLDVGCGQGQWVKTAASRGWDALGIDMSSAAIEICQSLGAPAQHVDFFDASLSSRRFDLLTMFELIEHVPNPGRFISRAEELLRPGGLMYLTTPNFGCLDRRVQSMDWEHIHAEHTTYFEPASIRELFERSGPGFEVVSIHTRNLSAKTLRALLRRDASAKTERSTPPGATVEKDHRRDRDLRRRLEGNAGLRLAKSAVNRALDWSDLGNAMVVLARRA